MRSVRFDYVSDLDLVFFVLAWSQQSVSLVAKALDLLFSFVFLLSINHIKIFAKKIKEPKAAVQTLGISLTNL